MTLIFLKNTELHGKTFAEAISNEGRAVVPPDLLDKDFVWKLALSKGRLLVLRIELNEDVIINTIGMHPPHELGEQNAAWLQISNHLKQSRSLNLVLTATPEDMESIVHEMVQAWTGMRTTPGPFYQFYGNHPDKPFVKSGSNNVPFDQRPVEFDAAAQVGFMHAHEYTAILAYGYIDEDDFQNHAIHEAIDTSKNEREQILAANHEMYMKRHEMKELWDLLLMQRASDFRSVDFYESIEGKFDFSKITDSLGQGQKAAFEGLRRMHSFAVALHGPPGTGKTHWACQILVPLVEHKNKETGNHHVIYAIAATNELADKFAVDLHRVLEEKVRRKDERPITVIRLLPWHVEDRIAAKDREDDRQRSFREGHPEDASVFDLIYDMIPPSTTSSLNDREQAVEKMHLQYRNSTVVPSSGFTDLRIKELPFHLGMHMIQELKADGERDERTRKWSELHPQLKSFRAGMHMSTEQMGLLKKGIRELRDFVLMNADVLVSTPYAACDGYLREIIRPSHIVIDQASQISEPRLWPTLAWYTSANNPSFKAMVLMGDHLQIPPTVLAPVEKCPFRSQLTVSFFYRLIANGLSLPALYQQRCMHKDIAAGPKLTYYGSRLRTHLSTNHYFNGGARAVRRFNKSLFKLESNVVLIDIPEGQQKVDSSTNSSYNEENVEAVVALIARILNDQPGKKSLGDICILTFYSAQQKLHQQAMMKLHADKPGLGADKVKIATVDSYQGLEADIIILDLVIVHNPGFTAVPGRLYSALTRAKRGLYVIASVMATVDACKEMRPRSKVMVAIFNYWISQRIWHRPKFIAKHIEDWKATRDKQALAADVDKMNIWAEVGRKGELEITWPHSQGESGWHEDNNDGDGWA